MRGRPLPHEPPSNFARKGSAKFNLRIKNEELRHYLRIFAECDENMSETARRLGTTRQKVAWRLHAARERRLTVDPTPVPPPSILPPLTSLPEPPPAPPYEAPPKSPQEIRDARFWRDRAASLEKELGDVTNALREMSGLMSRSPQPPEWALSKLGASHRAAGLLHISDIHAGEVVNANQIDGVNSYNLEICQTRLRRLFGAAIEILPRWARDCQLEGIIVAINGDLISGDIHEELLRTNALAAIPSVWFVADELAAGLAKLADVFGKVFACVTPGNHGRTTAKMPSKETANLSYDTAVGEALRRHFINDDRVTIAVSPSRDALYSVFGWNILQTHHDQGGGGGQGWAGPLLPVMRKGKQIEWTAAQRGVTYDIILTAHHHVSGKVGKILANGSVVGYNEYASSIRAAPELPQQWLCLLHETWALREMAEIKLETGRPAKKPHIVLHH